MKNIQEIKQEITASEILMNLHKESYKDGELPYAWLKMELTRLNSKIQALKWVLEEKIDMLGDEPLEF